MNQGKTNNTIQTFWIFIGSTLSLGFVIISSMILSRYFNKNDYGIYKQVMYVYNSLLVVFTLGIPKAYNYFLPRVKMNEAKKLIDKINLILVASGFFMSLFIFLGAERISCLLNNPDLEIPLEYFSLVPLFLLPTMGLEGILSTYKKSKYIAIYNTTTRILMLICVTIPVVFFKGNVNTAIIGFTIASFVCFLISLYLKYLPVKNETKNETKIKYTEILSYTLPIMFAGLWGILISSTDQFFISRFFGNEVFADFANGSIEIPFVGMIISASSIVIAPIFSKKVYENKEHSKNEIFILWQSVFSKSIKIIYPIVVFVFCFADTIMVLMYGENYIDSGKYFQIKTSINFFTLIAYGPLMLAIGANRYYYNVHMYGALILILLQWLSIVIFNSPIIVALISAICQLGRIFAMLLFISKYFEIKLLDLFPIKLILRITFPAFIIVFLLKHIYSFFITNSIVLILISLISYVLLFSIWIILNKLDYYSILSPLINKIIKRM